MKRLTLLGILCPLVLFWFPTSQLSAQTLPTVHISSNAPLCEGAGPILLHEDGGDASLWVWSGPNGFASTAQNPVIPNPIPSWSGNYTVTITNMSGVTNSATLNVQINPLPAVTTADVSICQGGSVTLSSGSAGATCFWQPATGLDNPNSCNPVASPASTLTYFVKVSTAAGCSLTKPVEVLVHSPGSMVCNNNIIISLDQSAVVEVTPIMVLAGSDPDDGFFTVDVTTNTGESIGNIVTCAQIGQTLTAKVTDICNGSACWGNVKVEDKLPPKVTCTDIFIPCAVSTYTPAYLQGTLGIAAAYPDVIENCINYTQGYSDVFHNQNCDDGINGVIDLSAYVARTWSFVDGHGNTAGCTQFIYIKRLHSPDLLFPPHLTVSCGSPNTSPAVTGAPYVAVNNVKFTLFPNPYFCEMSATYTDEIIGICDGSYKIIRTWLIYDWCAPISDAPPSNPFIYKQLIKVLDVAGPVMTCPADILVSTDAFNCCATLDLPDLILSDNCSRLNNIKGILASYDYNTDTLSAILAFNGILSNFPNNNPWAPDTLGQFGFTPCLPIGDHVFTYKAEDDCGNTATCSVKITIADITPPIVACDEFTKVGLTSSGTAEVFAETFDDGSFDQCCLPHFEARRMISDCNGNPDDFGPTVLFCCSDIGDTVPVILRVYDCYGNANECMVQVFVEDKIKPVCTPPANTTVSCENFDPSLGVYGYAVATDNCCIDTVTVKDNYNLFDTVCNFGTIVRTFKAVDCAGQTSTCTQRIVVFYHQDYYIKMPNDAVLKKCDGTGNFGQPSFFGQDCELIGVSYEDVVYTLVPDACYKIERTWKIINWCTYNPSGACVYVPNPNPSDNLFDPNNIRGPIIAPFGNTGPWSPTLVNLTPGSTVPTNFSDYYDPNANCYNYTQIIKIVDTQDPAVNAPAGPVTFCDLTPNDPSLWNAPAWWDNSIGSHNLCEGPADLNITAVDSCTHLNVNFRYFLFLDLDNDGTMETVINSISPPAAGTVNFNNAANSNFLGGDSRVFDQRNVPANAKYKFTVEVKQVGQLMQGAVRWNTDAALSQFVVPELPYGTHKIKWIVEDGCGNEMLREYTFTVKDCKAPTVVCHNGLSANIMPTGMITLWASDFLQYAEDNCTPATQLKIGIRKSGTGTGFPVDANGDPITSVTFNCSELGAQPVELWARDLADNADYCETYVLVQDNMGNCPNVNATIAGKLATEQAAGVEAGTVEISGSGATVPAYNFVTLSDTTGNYQFGAVPLQSDYTLTPTKDDNPLNGVTTYDLVLISKHILGLQPLNSPYKMIAADANKNGSITTTDIVTFRKLILGIYTELPDNTSWRFVDKKFVFPNPNNPFQAPFPENKTVAGLDDDRLHDDFVSVKIGDVNGSVIANAQPEPMDRAAETLLFDLEDCSVKAGEEVTVAFRPAAPVEGFQFTMNYRDMEVLSVLPGAGMADENFAVFPGDNALTSSWFRSQNRALAESDQPAFSIRFRAQKSGVLSQLLSVSNHITRAEAYTVIPDSDVPDILNIALRFQSGKAQIVTGVGFELYQNQPNPFGNKTFIGFNLPEAASATLTIFDETGRTLYRNQGDFAKGYNSFAVERTALKAGAMLYYKVETASDMATRKMIQMR